MTSRFDSKYALVLFDDLKGLGDVVCRGRSDDACWHKVSLKCRIILISEPL
jgi:hypothetical protein